MLAKLLFSAALCFLLVQDGVSLALPNENKNAQHEFIQSGKELFMPKRSEKCDNSIEQVKKLLSDLAVAILSLVAAPLASVLSIGKCVISSRFRPDELGECLFTAFYLIEFYVGLTLAIPFSMIPGIIAAIGNAIRLCLTLY